MNAIHRKERPIIFSGSSVRAILEGRKTVTRRVMKHQPHEDASVTVENYNVAVVDRHGEQQPGPEVFGAWWSDGERGCVCPYGQPGDRLWVRESLGYDCEYGHYFAAGGKHGETVYLCSLFDDEDAQTGPSYDGLLPERSVPSIHLHRRYSRILLEITDVRVERLQDISDADALAEGCSHKDMRHGDRLASVFARLWESINGAGSWGANPWVWVVEFRRIQP